MTINEICSNGFWIPDIHRVVASFLHQCVGCGRFRRPVEQKKMAELPQERVNQSPPLHIFNKGRKKNS